MQDVKSKRVSIDVNVNVDEANKSLNDINKKLKDMSKSIDISFKINKGKYSNDLANISSTITKTVSNINRSLGDIKFRINTQTARNELENFTASLTGVSVGFTNIANQTSRNFDSMVKSFANSFKGINNVVNQIKNSFSKLDGIKFGSSFMNKFSSSVSSKMKTLKSSISNTGGLVKDLASKGNSAGRMFVSNMIKQISSSAINMTKIIKKSIDDALKNDYSINLKAKGLKGNLVNTGINLGVTGKELKAVTKKLANDLLEVSTKLKQYGKVLVQAYSSIRLNSNKIGSAFNNLVSKLSNSANPFISIFGNLVKTFQTNFNFLIATVKLLDNAFSPLVTVVTNLVNVLLKLTQFVNLTSEKFVKTIDKNLGEPLNRITSKLSDSVDKFASKVNKKLDNKNEQLEENNKNIETPKLGGLQNSLKSLDAYMLKFNRLNNIISNIKAPISNVFNNISKGLSKFAKPIDFMGKLFKSMFSGVSKFVKVGIGISKKIISGIIGGLKLVGNVLKAFINIGKTITSAIAKGIRSGLSLITGAIRFISKGIIGLIKPLASTIKNTLSAAFSISGKALSGINNAIWNALASDSDLELDVIVKGSNKLLGNLFDKGNVTNQLKRDLGLVTANMAPELRKVTQVFGTNLIDAGTKVRQYANFMIQAYDFVRSNKGVIVSTFNRLYSVVAPVLTRIFNDLGVIIKGYGSKVISVLGEHLKSKLGPLVEPLRSIIDVIKIKFNELKDPTTTLGRIIKESTQLVNTSFTSLVQVTKTLLPVIKSYGEKLLENIPNIISFGNKIIKTIPNIIEFGNKTLHVANTIVKVINILLTPIKILIKLINTLLHPVKSTISIFKKIVEVSRTLPAILSKTKEGFINTTNTVVNGSKNLITKVTTVLLDGFKKIFESVTSSLTKFKDVVSNLGSTIKNKFTGGNNNSNNSKQTIYDSYGSSINNKKSTSDNTTKVNVDDSNVNEAKEKVEDLFSFLKDKSYDEKVDINFNDEFDKEIEKSKKSIKELDKVFKSFKNGASTINFNFKDIDTNFDNIKYKAKETKENIKEAFKVDDSNVKKAEQDLKQVGNQAKNLAKDIINSKIAAQKVDKAFSDIRHPIQALQNEMKAKLGKFDIKLKLQGEKEALKAATNVANAMNKFASAKGTQKLSAGLDVAIQSVKYKLTTLANTMKSNFVSNLIEKMTPKAKKASKELAENIPGGGRTINFFKSSLGKLSLLFGGIGIANYVKQATNLAIQYEASAMQIQRSLGSASQTILDFAEKSSAAFGISKTDTVKYGNIFSLMVRQFETDTEKIANTTNALLQSAAIVSSATGTELSTVMDGFRSALTG